MMMCALVRPRVRVMVVWDGWGGWPRHGPRLRTRRGDRVRVGLSLTTAAAAASVGSIGRRVMGGSVNVVLHL